MTTQRKEKAKTPNPILNAVTVFGIGTTVLGGTSSLTLSSLDLSQVYTQMFNGMFLSFNELTAFWAVFVAWIIAGTIGGVRAKNGFWGAVAGFFGSLSGVVFLVTANLTALEDSTALLEFSMGAAACIIITCAAAYIFGASIKAKPIKEKPKPTRKAWVASKTKEVWTCNRCGANIPPGAFSCPACGEPVIE